MFFKTFRGTLENLSRRTGVKITDIDTKNRCKMDFLTIKQYLISISPLTVKKSCLNFISLKR